MIDESELRTGNEVLHEGQACSVLAIGLKNGDYVLSLAKGINSRPQEASLMDVEPAKLNHDWLKLYGFEKIEVSQYATDYIKDGFKLREKHGFGKFFIAVWNAEEEPDHSLLVYADYVHSLQNLFFSLTGQELTIKP